MATRRHALHCILSLLCVSTALREASAAEKPSVLFIIRDDVKDYVGALSGHP